MHRGDCRIIPAHEADLHVVVGTGLLQVDSHLFQTLCLHRERFLAEHRLSSLERFIDELHVGSGVRDDHNCINQRMIDDSTAVSRPDPNSPLICDFFCTVTRDRYELCVRNLRSQQFRVQPAQSTCSDEPNTQSFFHRIPSPNFFHRRYSDF